MVFYSLSCPWQAPSNDIALSQLSHATAEVSEIVFFLLGAMTIVEIVDAHQGFKLVTDNITTRKPKTLLWVVSDSLIFTVSNYSPLCLVKQLFVFSLNMEIL